MRPWVVLALALTRAAPAVTFTHDIAPIVYRKCAPCHHPGEAAPFSLLTYLDVKKRAALISTVTGSGYMPPWLPQHGYGNFKGELRLTAGEKAIIADWVKAGTPEGTAGELPPAPRFPDGWQLGAPDMVLEAASTFQLPASGQDVYWNFIFTPALATRRWVRAIEIRPGDRRLVHHANLLVDRMASARAQETAPGKGFPGMDLVLMHSPFDPEGHFLFWKPGATPHVEPDGFAWRLDPGNLLVLNMHLQPSGKPEEVRPSIGLYFTDRPETKFPLLIQLENDNALDIPAGARDFVISDDFKLPMDADILAVYPHAHYLGKLLEAWATLPDGSKKWLIRIPDWDSNWQAVYYYGEPLFLPKDAVIHMRYQYDNSAANVRNRSHPPKRVRAGNQATDEMGHLWLQVLPRGAGDRRLELQEAVIRHRLEKAPGDFEAHTNLGAIELSRLNAQAAETELRVAVRLDPARPEAHNMLGLALAATGHNAEAMEQYAMAVRAGPEYWSARFNLATELAKAGKVDDAVDNLQRVLAANPEDPATMRRLSEVLTLGGILRLRDGKRDEAVAQFDEALKFDRSNDDARKNREQALGEAELNHALPLPSDAGSIHPRLTAVFSNLPENGSLINALLAFNPGELKWSSEPDGSHKALIHVAAAAYDENGLALPPVDTTFTLQLTSQDYDEAMKGGLVYGVHVPVTRPGRYVVRATVRDVATESTGSAEQFVEVPDVESGHLALSGMVLQEATYAALYTSVPFTPANADLPQVPAPGQDVTGGAARRSFRRGTLLAYGFKIINAATGAGQFPELEVQTKLLHDGAPVLAGKTTLDPQGAQGTPDPQRLLTGGRLSLGRDMQPGQYVLQVTVNDRLAKSEFSTVTQSMDFEIEP